MHELITHRNNYIVISDKQKIQRVLNIVVPFKNLDKYIMNIIRDDTDVALNMHFYIYDMLKKGIVNAFSVIGIDHNLNDGLFNLTKQWLEIELNNNYMLSSIVPDLEEYDDELYGIIDAINKELISNINDIINVTHVEDSFSLMENMRMLSGWYIYKILGTDVLTLIEL